MIGRQGKETKAESEGGRRKKAERE